MSRDDDGRTPSAARAAADDASLPDPETIDPETGTDDDGAPVENPSG